MAAHARIGIFVEDGETAVADCLSTDELELAPGASGGTIVVFRAPSWTSQDAPPRIGRLCRQERLDQVVICGPSPASGLLPEWVEIDHRPPVPVTWAAIREHCAWVEKDEVARAAKARRLVEMAVARARGAEPGTFADVAPQRAVAVVGSNHAAYQMASVLLDADLPVILLKTEPPEGCFFAVPTELVQRVTCHPDAQVVADAVLEDVAGHVGNFRLRVATPSGRVSFRVGALVVAVDAQTGPLGLGSALDGSGCVLGLREYGQMVPSGALDGKAACIWLDRDGFDRRCAGQAALAFALEHAHRGGRPTVLFRQMPLYQHSGQRLYDNARAAGVTVIRYDGTSPRFTVAGDAIGVAVTDSVLPDRTLEFVADRLVTPVPARPTDSHSRIAALLRQPLDLQGYLQPGNVRHRPVGSARRGVYFVGGCHDECDPQEAGLEAWAVLGDLMTHLPRQTIRAPLGKVIVNAEKCAACLTCYRQCPHGAIEPSPSQHRMEILDPACWQCGICAAVCPGRALEHGSLRFDQMHDMLTVATRDMLGRPPIIAFACRQSAVPAADAAGHARLSLPTDVLLVDIPCAGLIGEQIVLDALEQGARGVLVLGCHHDNCRSLRGSDLARNRVEKVRQALGALGVQEGRVQFDSLAANEPHRLAHLLARASEDIPAGRFGQ